jgi:hypothetical protein
MPPENSAPDPTARILPPQFSAQLALILQAPITSSRARSFRERNFHSIRLSSQRTCRPSTTLEIIPPHFPWFSNETLEIRFAWIGLEILFSNPLYKSLTSPDLPLYDKCKFHSFLEID